MINLHKSRKGTPYVWASELRLNLEIRQKLEDWIAQIIDLGFKKNEEYSIHTRRHTDPEGNDILYRDWAIHIDMAKHIALIQNTKRSKALRTYLINIEKKFSEGELVNRKQIKALIDLCKVLGLFSIQKYLENEHYQYVQKPSNWWSYRARLLGFNAKDLKEAVLALGEK